MEIRNLYFAYGRNDKRGEQDILFHFRLRKVKLQQFLGQMVVENQLYFSL